MSMEVAIGHAERPCNNCPPCGDGWLCLEQGPTIRIMLADGMGHGVHAHRIVELLSEQLRWICARSSHWISPLDSLQTLNARLQEQGPEWQAAVAIVDLDRQHCRLECVVVGNIQVHYESGAGSLGMHSMRGMVGGRFPGQLDVRRWTAEPDSLLALFSDGVDSHAAREAIRMIHGRSSAGYGQMQSEAESLVRQFGRLSDDASCALLKLGDQAD